MSSKTCGQFFVRGDGCAPCCTGHPIFQCPAGKNPKSGGTLVGTRLCLQSRVCYTLVPTVQKPCSHGLQNKKAMKSFDFTASTVDIPSCWDPQAKQSPTGALLAALCAAALFEPLPSCGQKEKPVHNVYWFFLVRWKGLEPPAY